MDTGEHGMLAVLDVEEYPSLVKVAVGEQSVSDIAISQEYP